MPQPIQLFESASGIAVGGLDWRAGTRGKSPVDWARVYRKDTEFTHFVSVTRGEGPSAVRQIGIYATNDDSTKPPKRAYSVALAFAIMHGGDSPDAALLMKLDPVTPEVGGAESGDRYYVVVLADGVPSLDQVVDEKQANALTRDREVFSNLRHAGAPFQFEDLDEDAAASRLKAIPVDVVKVSIAAVAFAVAAGSWVAYTVHKRAEEARKAAEAAAAADPVPRYLAGLQAAKSRALPVHDDLDGVARMLFSLPTVAKGWSLEEASCDIVAQRCSARWARRGGTYEDLRAALPQQEMSLAMVGGASPDLDRAITSFAVAVRRVPLTEPGQKLLKLQDLHLEFGGLLQVWRTAKLRVERGPAALWPAVADVPATLDHPQAVLRVPLTVTDIASPFLVEAMTRSPWFVDWQSVTVSVTEGGDPAARVKFSLKGSAYASQH